MKKFKETLINKSNIDLSSFNTIIKEKEFNGKEKGKVCIESNNSKSFKSANSKIINLNEYKTIIKYKKPVETNETEVHNKEIIIKEIETHANTITINKVEKGLVPSVINEGTPENAILNFILPEGEKGKDGITPSIKIGNVLLGEELQITNSGTETNIILDFILPTPKNGKQGKKGNDGYTPIKGLDYFDGKEGYTPKKGKDYFDGTSPTLNIESIKWGDNLEVKNIGTPENILLEIFIPKPKDGYTPVKEVDYSDGKDGYTPIKNVDYFDGKDGYTPIKNVDYFDGKDGYTPVKEVDYSDGKDGYTPIKGIDYFDGKDGYTPIKNVDYFDGKDGYTPIKGIDYFDGKDGHTPKHQIDNQGNIRFEIESGKWGKWIPIYDIIHNTTKHYLSKPDARNLYGFGGGDVLTFINGTDLFQNIKFLNIDTESLIVSQNGNTLTIGVNPDIINNGGTGTNIKFTFDHWLLPTDNIYYFPLSKTAIANSETVILNGISLTLGVDYTFENNTIKIFNEHETKAGWNITIKYAY